jgi:hypothetical protein
VLNNENVWAKAMNRVVNDKVPVDKAVDEMIARIKTVAALTPRTGAATASPVDAMSRTSDSMSLLPPPRRSPRLCPRSTRPGSSGAR